MILRRISESLRKQDWFTVVLEVMIVVVGIFLGLQVDDWNQGRKDRVDEKIFMSQLHADILSAEGLSNRLLDRRLNRRESAIVVMDILFGRLERDSLTDAECVTAGTLHYFNIIVAELTAVSELKSTGRMAIIQDSRLRIALAELQQTRAAVENIINLQGSVTYDLPARYSDLIWRDAYFDPADEEIHGIMKCDLPGMRANRSLLNNFSANVDAYDAYITDGLAPWATQFDVVHQLVDQALEISHLSESD